MVCVCVCGEGGTHVCTHTFMSMGVRVCGVRGVCEWERRVK